VSRLVFLVNQVSIFLYLSLSFSILLLLYSVFNFTESKKYITGCGCIFVGLDFISACLFLGLVFRVRLLVHRKLPNCASVSSMNEP
jgi:hypothetical protein